MRNVNFIEAVTERDIDILLLEELTVSSSFQNWLVSKVINCHIDKIIGVWHSITEQGLGESDLVVVFMAKTGIKFGLLIENKIGALAQPEQASRYEQRGVKGIENGYWDKFFTCIVAPNRYLDTNCEAEKYQKCILYEEIRDYFLTRQDKRSDFRANMISNAIEQNRRGYIAIPDGQVTDFWKRYFNYVNVHYPKFEMNEPGPRPSNSDFVYFQPNILEGRMNIVHKLSRGVVDLQIPDMGEKLDELSSKFSEYLNKEIELAKTNKSGSFRIRVPASDTKQPFEKQVENVEEGLIAVGKLLDIGVKIKSKL